MAIASTFMKWAPAPNVCRCRSASLQPSSRTSTFALKQQATFFMGESTVETLAPVQSRKEAKGKMKKGSFLGEKGSSQSGYADLENREVYVDDDDEDGDRNGKEQNEHIRRAQLKEMLSQIRSNAQNLKPGSSRYPAWYSLGVDFGDVRTGVAISKGFSPRPIEVVELQGQKLEARLIEIAQREKAIEFVVGLPKSSTGLETPQSSKTRCFAGRLAVLAAQRGWRVYLHDEFGSSDDALDYMLMMGSTRKSRKTQLDAYAAVVLLQAYFDSSGEHAELVVPKRLSLQEHLCEGPIVSDSDDDDFNKE